MRRYDSEIVICKALEKCKEIIITPKGIFLGCVIDSKAIIPFGDWIDVYDKEEYTIRNR